MSVTFTKIELYQGFLVVVVVVVEHVVVVVVHGVVVMVHGLVVVTKLQQFEPVYNGFVHKQYDWYWLTGTHWPEQHGFGWLLLKKINN